MLKKDKIFTILIISILIWSCNAKKGITRIETINFIQDYLGKNKYDSLIVIANQAIKSMIKDKTVSGSQFKRNEWKTDSLFCINKMKNKVIFIVMVINKESPMDDLRYLYGVKIKDIWYFFDGPTNIILRYNKDSNFEDLSKKAYQDVLKNYLFRNEKGELEINDHFFDDLTSNAWSDENVKDWDKERWDKRYLEIVRENRAKIDTNDYSKMQ